MNSFTNPAIDGLVPQTGPDAERSTIAPATSQLLAERTDSVIDTRRPGTRIGLFHARQGYDLQPILEPLAHVAMEPNIFFDASFLAPAMPRLEDRTVRFAMLYDEQARPRPRFLMPYTVEKPGFSVGPTIMRSWSNAFGPLGTPLVDARDAGETIDLLLETLSSTQTALPKILVLPDLRMTGLFTETLRAIALSRELPLSVVNAHDRLALESYEDGETYLTQSMSGHHRRDLTRQERSLEKLGVLGYEVFRQPIDVRIAMEQFMALEAAGWKGGRRTALMSDRLHSAFAREAIANLAAQDKVRIHALTLDGRMIAAMVILLSQGIACTWKTTYDETLASYSPGKVLMTRLTEWQLDDANIVRTESLAADDHPLISRFWRERDSIGTLVIGLGPNSDRDVRQVSAQLHLYRNTRNIARSLRDKIMALAGRS